MIPPLLFEELALLEPHRLAIACLLAEQGEPVPFAAMRRVLGLTDGNLDRHLHRLIKEGVVESRRERKPARQPRTTFTLTAEGRKRLTALGSALRHAAAGVASVAAGPTRSRSSAAEAAPEIRSLVDDRFAGLD